MRTAEDGAQGVVPGYADHGGELTEEQEREVVDVIAFFGRAARDHPRDRARERSGLG